jgi:CsoR family transcriptional regulator, copper-sensing transcriptional repressor
MGARLTLPWPAPILPTSMETDAQGGHFRHSYTKDKRDLVTRLRRIEGQARGIQRLVEEEAYCLDVLQQVEALTAAADQVGLLLLEDHIDGCLAHAIQTGQGQPYVDEVMAVVRRTMGRRGPRRPVAGTEA